MEKMLSYNNLRINDIVVVICVWFAASASLMSDSVNQIALYVVLPFAFITTFISYRKLRVNKYFNLLVLLYLWICFSVTWATDIVVALGQIKQIMGSFILSYIIATKARNPRNIPWLYVTYIILLVFAWNYAYNNIYTGIDLEHERINDKKLNANTLAYYTFYVTFTLFMLGEIMQKALWMRFFRILFLIIIPISFYTSIYTASRQVLIIQIPLISILLYIRYIKGKNLIRKFIFVSSLAVCLNIAIPAILKVYSDSYLKERVENDVMEDSRLKLAKDAFRVGLEYFPLGVGPGNYRVHSFSNHFSHNVYLELFANEGVVGLFIYIYIIGLFIKRQWRRYKYFKDDVYLYFFIFGLFFVIDGLFYSFYEHLWLIGFFILVVSHSEIYFRVNTVNLNKF